MGQCCSEGAPPAPVRPTATTTESLVAAAPVPPAVGVPAHPGDSDHVVIKSNSPYHQVEVTKIRGRTHYAAYTIAQRRDPERDLMGSGKGREGTIIEIVRQGSELFYVVEYNTLREKEPVLAGFKRGSLLVFKETGTSVRIQEGSRYKKCVLVPDKKSRNFTVTDESGQINDETMGTIVAFNGGNDKELFYIVRYGTSLHDYGRFEQTDLFF